MSESGTRSKMCVYNCVTYHAIYEIDITCKTSQVKAVLELNTFSTLIRRVNNKTFECVHYRVYKLHLF